jgi:renierapurpurin 18,18'-hydroxylase
LRRADKAAGTPLPELPASGPGQPKVMMYSRSVACHYSFMHENLLDMNHQFLHRGVVGRIHPRLLGYESGPRFVEARYRFRPARVLPVGGLRTGSPSGVNVR